MAKFKFGSTLGFLFATCTSIIGYHVNTHLGSICPGIWAFFDFFLAPFAWLKWLVFGQVNLTIIKEAFSFFLT